jgi:hypothetical protein
MATVRDPAAHARAAAHTVPPLRPEPPLATLAALHGGRQHLRATLHTAAPLDAGTAVVEEPAVGAPAAVPIRGAPGGGVHHGPKRYGCSGRPARSPHIV